MFLVNKVIYNRSIVGGRRTMRWIWVMAVLGMVIAGFPQETQQEMQSADLSKDARLQKPITLWYSIEPLPEVLKAVQKQTGVRFICPDRFRNEKVAIFVENRPAHEVLTRLAEVFRIEWREERDEYRVERPFEEVRLEEEARRVMREARRKALSEYLAMLRRVLSMSDAQRKQRKEALEQKQKTQGYESLSYFEISELSFLDYLLPAKGYWADNDLVMPFLASLPKQETERLLNHHLLAYSTRPAQNVGTIPSAVIEKHYSLLEAFVKSLEPEKRLGYEYLLKRRPLGMSLCFRLSPITYQIVCQFSISKEDEFEREIRGEQCQCQIQYSTIYPGFDESEVQKAPLVQRWIQWAELADTLNEWIQTKRPTPNREPFPPNWHPKRIPIGFNSGSNRYVISAKFLELLAWRYGIPVVADSFRTSSIYMSSDSGVDNHWFEDFLNNYWLRREGDYLLGRRKYYWGWRSVEPEETVLRALETKFQQGEDLTIDDYARFAVSLNDRQYNYLLEMDLTSYFLEYALVIEIPLTPLKQLPLLRFWGTLTPQQRASVLAGEFLPVRLLNPVQRKAFAHALEPLFPHPNRLTTAPCTSSCYVPTVDEWLFWGHDILGTSAISGEEGFSAILPSQKLIRELWYKSDESVMEMRRLSDREDIEFHHLAEDEEIVRKERYKGDLYLFHFVAPPHIVVRYQFVYFKPVQSNPKPVEETPKP